MFKISISKEQQRNLRENFKKSLPLSELDQAHKDLKRCISQEGKKLRMKKNQELSRVNSFCEHLKEVDVKDLSQAVQGQGLKTATYVQNQIDSTKKQVEKDLQELLSQVDVNVQRTKQELHEEFHKTFCQEK